MRAILVLSKVDEGKKGTVEPFLRYKFECEARTAEGKQRVRKKKNARLFDLLSVVYLGLTREPTFIYRKVYCCIYNGTLAPRIDESTARTHTPKHENQYRRYHEGLVVFHKKVSWM